MLGAAAVILLTILFFQWAGGITPYDILTLDQGSRLELEGLTILYMQVATVIIGAPLGCWILLRKERMAGAGVTALLTIPWSGLLHAAVLRHIPAGPEDPLILPFAFAGTIIIAAALARLTTLLIYSATR